MGNPEKNKFLHKKKLLVVAGVVGLAIAAAGAGALVFWLQNQNRVGAPDSSSDTTEIGTPEERLPKEVLDAQALALDGKVTESNKKLAKALSEPGVTDETKYALIVQQGVNLENQGKHSSALTFFLAAEKIKPNFNISRQIGNTAQAKGDKALALTYFKKALTQLDKNHPMYEGEKRILDQKVKENGG